MLFCCLLILSKSTFSKKIFRNAIKVSYGMDPDQAGRFVGSDLGPNILQRLSVDDTRSLRVNYSQGPFESTYVRICLIVSDMFILKFSPYKHGEDLK